jgi:hypothetical protein
MDSSVTTITWLVSFGLPRMRRIPLAVRARPRLGVLDELIKAQPTPGCLIGVVFRAFCVSGTAVGWVAS